jgi:hypothetical protein
MSRPLRVLVCLYFSIVVVVVVNVVGCWLGVSMIV